MLRVDTARDVIIYTEPRWIAIQNYTSVSDCKADVYAAVEAWQACSAECRSALREGKGWTALQLTEMAVHIYQQAKVVTQPPEAEAMPTKACGSVISPAPATATTVEEEDEKPGSKRIVRQMADIRLNPGWEESQPTRVIEEAMRLIVREWQKNSWGYKYDPEEQPLAFPTKRNIADVTVDEILQMWPRDEWGCLIQPSRGTNFFRTVDFDGLNEKKPPRIR